MGCGSSTKAKQTDVTTNPTATTNAKANTTATTEEKKSTTSKYGVTEVKKMYADMATEGQISFKKMEQGGTENMDFKGLLVELGISAKDLFVFDADGDKNMSEKEFLCAIYTRRVFKTCDVNNDEALSLPELSDVAKDDPQFAQLLESLKLEPLDFHLRILVAQKQYGDQNLSPVEFAVFIAKAVDDALGASGGQEKLPPI